MARTGLPFALVLEKGSLRDEALDEPPRTPPAPGQRIDLREGGDRPTRLALLERCWPRCRTTCRSSHHRQGRAGAVHPRGPGAASLSGRLHGLRQPDGAGRGADHRAPHGRAGRRRRGADEARQPGDHRRLSARRVAARAAGQRRARLDRRAGDRVAQRWISPPWRWPAAIATPSSATASPGSPRRSARRWRLDGPVLVHARIRPGSLEKLGRPTIAPHEVAQRFRGFLARSGQAAD